MGMHMQVVFDTHKLLVDVCVARKDFANVEAYSRLALQVPSRA